MFVKNFINEKLTHMFIDVIIDSDVKLVIQNAV